MTERLDGDADALGKLLEAVPEVVLVIDREGTIQYVNRLEEGYKREDVIGMRADAVLAPGAREEFWAHLASVCKTGEVREYEMEASSPAGEKQWYRSRMEPFRSDGAVTRVVILATNISELKAAEAEAERWRRLVPICSWCDKIRDEAGEWKTIEAHLERETGTKVSHGMCPDCYREHLEGAEGENGNDGNAA